MLSVLRNVNSRNCILQRSIVSISNAAITNDRINCNFSKSLVYSFHTSLLVAAPRPPKKEKPSGPIVPLPVTKDLGDSMDKRLSYLVEEFAKIRGGRASADILNHVTIEAYDLRVNILEACQITMLSPTKLSVAVFDLELVENVASAIRSCGLNLNPTTDGTTITVAVPKPSKEARDGLVKSISKLSEKTKQDIRQVRKLGMDQLKAAKSSHSEDVIKRMTKEVDALTKKKEDRVKEMLKTKEKELGN